jgi:site-specific recombinase XerD
MENLSKANPRDRNPFRILTENEVAHLLKNTKNLKHRCILTLIYTTGIRGTELTKLKISDIDVKQNLMVIRGSKGKPSRMIMIVPKAMYLIRQYFQKYRPRKYMFENPDGEMYSASSFQQVFSRALERSDLDRHITLNSLRVSLTANLKHRGNKIRHIGEIMQLEYVMNEPNHHRLYLESINKSLQKINLSDVR